MMSTESRRGSISISRCIAIAAPSASKPGPRLATVAGTVTFTAAGNLAIPHFVDPPYFFDAEADGDRKHDNDQQDHQHSQDDSDPAENDPGLRKTETRLRTGGLSYLAAPSITKRKGQDRK